jgi:hypothetical protein
MRVLARSVVDSVRLESEDSPVRDPEARARLAAVIAELAGAVRSFGQLIEADPELAPAADAAPEPIAAQLEDHLEEAHRQQDRLADALRTDPAERPEGWPLRGEILAHVDRLRSELETKPVPPQDRARRPLRTLRARQRAAQTAPRRRENRSPLRVRAGQTALRVRAGQNALRVQARRTASRVRRSG